MTQPAKAFIFPGDDGVSVTVGYVVDPSAVPAESAKVAVPQGRPYLIVNVADLPDIKYHSAWRADFSYPDGYGEGPA